MTRETIVAAHRQGVAVLDGLIAHGRGEAFDYLLGEETSAPALVAEHAAAAYLLTAKRPVISVNGNVAALAAKEVARLAAAISARVEVNLFHRTEARVKKIVGVLRRAGAKDVLGPKPDARIPGLESKRAWCHRGGIYGADVVLVPLEDGDRAEALVRMGKVVISVDLNPLSRTSLAATVPIVDEVTRALVNVTRFSTALRERSGHAERIVKTYDRAGNLAAVYAFLGWRLANLVQASRRRPRERSKRAAKPSRRG